MGCGLYAGAAYTRVNTVPFDKLITIDINHVNVIDCIDQSIKIDTTLLVITVINVIDFIDGC